MKHALKIALLAGAGIGLASAALATDLPTVPEMDASTAMFYVGLNAGYGFGNADHQPAVPIGPGGNGYDLSLAGFIVGGQVGAMFQLTDNLMGGFQVDVDWSNITGSNTFAPGGFRSHTINWIATAEGRLGFDTGGFTPYLALGVALAQATRTATATDTQMHTGLSLGAGVMVPVSDNVSLDVEYRYQAFQPMTYATGGTPPSVALNVNTIRAGINFSF
jgi:outer membrane immunogenic protein